MLIIIETNALEKCNYLNSHRNGNIHTGQCQFIGVFDCQKMKVKVWSSLKQSHNETHHIYRRYVWRLGKGFNKNFFVTLESIWCLHLRTILCSRLLCYVPEKSLSILWKFVLIPMLECIWLREVLCPCHPDP